MGAFRQPCAEAFGRKECLSTHYFRTIERISMSVSSSSGEVPVLAPRLLPHRCPDQRRRPRGINDDWPTSSRHKDSAERPREAALESRASGGAGEFPYLCRPRSPHLPCPPAAQGERGLRGGRCMGPLQFYFFRTSIRVGIVSPWLSSQHQRWSAFWAQDERITEVEDWILKDRWTDL
jgi:hypothetical protein